VSNPVNQCELVTLTYEKEGQIRYYSLARHALLNALKLAGIHAGSRVLLPSFLCRDLLAPLNILSAIPYWYEVDHSLSPLLSSEFWPSADVVLMVDYFGFPQNITPFKLYAQRTGAIIIEDNAHGFLSRDQHGNFLGCRAHFGIFSIRKTLRIPDGAALWTKSLDNWNSLPLQLPFKGAGVNPAQLKKLYIRSLPMVGEFLFKALTKCIRILRAYILTDKNSSTDSEFNLAFCPEPWHGLPSSLKNLDIQGETKRRRSSYLDCSAECEKIGGIPVYDSLPVNCVPYAYAFRGNQKVASAMQKYADRHGFDMVTWPDLPGAIINQAPEHYRNIYLINLTW